MNSLPKPDRRYKKDIIKRDKNGCYRGNPDTVTLKRMAVPKSAPVEMQLNPPIIASEALAIHLIKEGLIDVGEK